MPVPGTDRDLRRIDVVDVSGPAARAALANYVAELAERFPEGFDAAAVHDGAPATFTPPRGLFLLATDGDGATLGCAGLTFLDAATAEAKRMWVSPTARGAGVGSLLLARLEAEARAAGRTALVLDTNRALTEAVALYERRGYSPIPRYNDNPYAHHWFRKELPLRLAPDGADPDRPATGHRSGSTRKTG